VGDTKADGTVATGASSVGKAQGGKVGGSNGSTEGRSFANGGKLGAVTAAAALVNRLSKDEHVATQDDVLRVQCVLECHPPRLRGYCSADAKTQQWKCTGVGCCNRSMFCVQCGKGAGTCKNAGICDAARADD
jgi:hypothetical protein